MHDSGIINIYHVDEVGTGGSMPSRTLRLYAWFYYEERQIGVTRMYAARGANASVDALVRVWQDRGIEPDMIAIFENGKQYRIDSVQHTRDDDGINVSDLTLVRLEDFYDVNE